MYNSTILFNPPTSSAVILRLSKFALSNLSGTQALLKVSKFQALDMSDLQSCGRAGCDLPPKKKNSETKKPKYEYYAFLQFDGKETEFDCKEQATKQPMITEQVSSINSN